MTNEEMKEKMTPSRHNMVTKIDSKFPERILSVVTMTLKIFLSLLWLNKKLDIQTSFTRISIKNFYYELLQTGAIEGQMGRRTGVVVSLSEQNLIDCSSNYGNNGCNGGNMALAFSYVRDYGIVSENDYPYTESQGICRQDPSRIVTRVSGSVSIPYSDELSLQNALSSIGPISVAIDATAELQGYSGGILRDYSCNNQALNHGVLAVGYGSENGQDYYIVKNSWGAAWGEAGYFRLEKDNRCGIANMASYPVM